MKQYVYESPDGGHTVYRREMGKIERELHSLSEEKRKWDQRVQREMLWAKIVSAAETDPELQTLLDQAEIYFHLKHEKN